MYIYIHTYVFSLLAQEDPLEEEMTTHSRILARISHGQSSTVHGVTKSWTRLIVHANLKMAFRIHMRKSFYSYVYLCVVVQLFVTPWIVAHQVPLSMEFSNQEYWSVLPFPTPRGLLDPRIKPTSPALAGRFFTAHHLGNHMCVCASSVMSDCL